MATSSRSEFVSLIAEEITLGIGHALDYWLGRIELEIVDKKLTAAEQVRAIEFILREYKELAAKTHMNCASA